MPDALIYSQIKDFCVGEIKDLIGGRQDIFGPSDWTVYRQMQDDQTNKTYPCFTLTEVGLAPELMGGDTENFHWMLPFNLLIQDREAGTLHEKEGYYMGVHQCLMDHFRQALLKVDNRVQGIQGEVFPKPVFEKNDGRYQDVMGGMVLKFWVVESRSA